MVLGLAVHKVDKYSDFPPFCQAANGCNYNEYLIKAGTAGAIRPDSLTLPPMALLIAKRHLAAILLMAAVLSAPSLFGQEDASQGKHHPGEKQRKDHLQNRRSGTSFSENLFTGGNMGAWVGNITYVNASPILGYWIKEKELAAGVGATYQYYNNKSIGFATSIYGGSAFLRYYLGETVFTHGQYEVLNIEAFDQFHGRVNIPALLLGAGYSQPMGENSAFDLMFLWNFSETRYSPYSNPVIRAGFIFGM
jgi:hypothetical protein